MEHTIDLTAYSDDDLDISNLEDGYYIWNGYPEVIYEKMGPFTQIHSYVNNRQLRPSTDVPFINVLGGQYRADLVKIDTITFLKSSCEWLGDELGLYFLKQYKKKQRS